MFRIHTLVARLAAVALVAAALGAFVQPAAAAWRANPALSPRSGLGFTSVTNVVPRPSTRTSMRPYPAPSTAAQTRSASRVRSRARRAGRRAGHTGTVPRSSGLP